MIITNWKNPFSLHGLHKKIFRALRAKGFRHCSYNHYYIVKYTDIRGYILWVVWISQFSKHYLISGVYTCCEDTWWMPCERERSDVSPDHGCQNKNRPANTIHRNNLAWPLVQRLRRWPNIKTTLSQCIVFAGRPIERSAQQTQQCATNIG